MADPGVMLSSSLADAVQRMVAEWENGELDPVAERVRFGTGQRPPMRGILLSPLVDGGKADCAFSMVDTTSYLQLIELVGNPTGGTFTLTFNNQTTKPIPWNATNLQVQTALAALSSINGPQNVSVALGKQAYVNSISQVQTSQFPGVWLVTFQGVFAQSKNPPPLMTGIPSISGLAAMTINATQWNDAGHVETVRPIIPLGTPTPAVAGAVVAGLFYPGYGYGVLGCECRSFAPGPF